MSRAIPGLREAISELVRDSELETVVSDASTVEIRHVSDQSRGVVRERREEKWDHQKELGAGSFGVVHLHKCASGPRAGQTRAVKKIRVGSGLSKDDVNAISRELAAIFKFSHEQYRDCFVRSFGWYSAQNSIFITMEYFPLGDLQSYLGSPIPETQAQRITEQILQGLTFMHRNNYAHRDLKPSNILVQQKSPSWWVKISDFGTSKQIGSTALRTITGTPQYLAPELQNIFAPADLDIIEKQTYTLAVDMWSVGAMVFRMLTGRLPFDQPATLYRYVLVGDPFPAVDGLSGECLSFVSSLMGASPRQRPTAKDAMTNAWLKTQSSPSEEPSTTRVNVKAAAKAFEANPTFRSQYSNQWTTMDDSTVRTGTQNSGRWTTFSDDTRAGTQNSGRWTTLNDTTRTETSTIKHSPVSVPAPAPAPAPAPPPAQPAEPVTKYVRPEDRPWPRPRPKMRAYYWKRNVIDGLESRALSLAISPDQKWIAASFLGEKYKGEHIIIWSYEWREGPKQTQKTPMESCPRDLIFGPTSKRLLSNNLDGWGGKLITWKLDDGQFVPATDHTYFEKKYFRLTNSHLSANGQLLLLTYINETAQTSQVVLWRMSQAASSDGRFQETKTRSYPKYDYTEHICSPDGRMYVEVSGADKNAPVRTWKLNDSDHFTGFPGLWGGRTFKFPEKLSKDASKISPDNRWIIFTSELDDDKTKTAVIEFKTDKFQGSLPFNTQQVESLAWSSDSRRVAIGLQDGKITVWQMNSNNNVFEYLQALEGHTGAVTGLVFSEDDGLLLSRSKDETIIIWGR